MVVAGDFKNGITFEMDGNVYQIIPETFHPDKMENTLQFHMQLIVNDK